MSNQVKEYDIEFNINGNNSVYSNIVNSLKDINSKVIIEEVATKTSANAKSLLNIVRLNIVPKNKYIMYVIGCNNFDSDCKLIENLFSKYAKVIIKE